jgi:Protein of unknown function (DUF1638)
MKIAVITCAVLEMELRYFARSSPQVIHFEVVEQGLHNEPDKLRVKLQDAIDRVEANVTDADAIVLGYGLCSRGTEKIYTTNCKLVMARAHDCITLLLGSKERYAEYVARNPGTYWYSPGWNKHALMPGQERYEKLYREYFKKYGADNATFLMESEQHWFHTYNNAAFVDLGIGNIDRDLAYTKQCAKWLGWKCDHQCGDPALLRDLLTGHWDDKRFLVIGPGETFRLVADERIIERVPRADEGEPGHDIAPQDAETWPAEAHKESGAPGPVSVAGEEARRGEP